MIRHKHRKPPKNQKYTWDKFPMKTEKTDKGNVVPLKKENVVEAWGIKPFTLKKQDKWRIVETDLQLAVAHLSFVYTYLLDNWKMTVSSYEMQKIAEENKEQLSYVSNGNKKLGSYHEQFVNEYGFLREPSFMQEDFVSISETDIQFVLNVLPLGKLITFAQEENYNQVEKYFKKKKEGSVFHLMPVQSETGLMIDYQSLTLRDAIEHEAVLICQRQSRLKRCIQCSEPMPYTRTRKKYCSDRCKTAYLRNKKNRTKYENKKN
jgi:hypothetical protein|tara:strand:+ start:431 stop:1219 length:789 start_codon:yes stop_codon:yes gene_type:complete